MGPVMTARAVRHSRRTGTESANCVDNKLKVLVDKRNHMGLRRSRRNVASPQPNMGSGQKPCIYKVDNTDDNQDLPAEERLALYTFKVDEYDSQPKKPRHKRNVRRRKKTDFSDTMDDEYTPSINVNKRLRPGTNWIVTRQKKQLSTGVTCSGKMALNNEGISAVAGNRLKCLNRGVAHQEKLTLQKEDTLSVTGGSFKCPSPGVAAHNSGSHKKTETENKENIAVVDTITTCQVTNVTRIEPRSVMIGNKADRTATVHQKPNICTNLTDDSELNFSVVESEPEQASSSCSSSPLISPVVRCFSQRLMMRQPGERKDAHDIRSVEDYTIDNYFGFDEEPEDDLPFSLPQVKVACSMKTVMSVPFAISSTPNPKPSFTRPDIKSVRSVQARTQTRTTLVSVHSTILPTASSVSAPKLLLESDMTPFDTVKAADIPCASVIYSDDSVPVQHFMKPPRRSYERPIRSYQESLSEDSLSDDEACSRKQSKRSKKARMQEEKTLKKWAANVSAEFDEIDSFKLCVE